MEGGRDLLYQSTFTETTILQKMWLLVIWLKTFEPVVTDLAQACFKDEDVDKIFEEYEKLVIISDYAKSGKQFEFSLQHRLNQGYV